MESVLQFGTGRFLRAFVDRFVQQANDDGQNVGQVVVVQSTGGERAGLLQKSDAGFHVVVRGYENGQLIDRVEKVQSISRALTASDAWPVVLDVARSGDLRFIVSNATEAGYVLDEADAVDSSPPRTLPAKLAQVLWARFQAGAPGVTLLPCELIERNAVRLLDLVRTQADRWRLPADFRTWLGEQCLWLSNLVDCIVTPGPADHPLSASDPLLTSAEPYALWAVEKPAGRDAKLFVHPAIKLVDDLLPFYLRKVRILNGLHTAMTAKFLPAGFETVQDVLKNATACKWLRSLLYEEIIPTIAYRVDDTAEFADETWDRFRNPFLRHRLSDIAANHAAKAQVRLQPTHDEYVKLFNRPPKRLAEALAWRG
jgi:tagaturonate reductase